MTALAKIWAWVQLNGVLLAVAVAFCAVATASAYFTGRGHGGDACEARYEKRDSAQHKEVIAELITINKQNAALAKKWDAENTETNSSVSEEIRVVYRTLEKVVEVPVLVQGPCAIDHAGAARVLDDATRAAFDN